MSSLRCAQRCVVAVTAVAWCASAFAQGTMELRPTRASGTEGVDWELGPGANEITLVSGDQSVEFELFVSGWGAGTLMTSYTGTLDCSQFASGTQGTLAPILVLCADAAPGDYCQVVDENRPTYAFGGVPAVTQCDINTTCSDGSPGRVRCGAAVLVTASGNSDGSGTEYYGATFALDVSANAKGTFTVGLDPDISWTYFTLNGTTDVSPTVIAGAITVTTGRCCNVAGFPLGCTDGVTQPECDALGGMRFAAGESCCGTDANSPGIDDACLECLPQDCPDGTHCENVDCVSGDCGGGFVCVYTSTVPEGMCGDPTVPGCPHTPISDGDRCTIDTCDPATGEVTHAPDPACIPIPTASSWGVACMALLVITTATLVFRPRRVAVPL